MRKNPHAVALGRKGGKAGKGKSSPAKAAAARANGRKGGRPRTALVPKMTCPECGRVFDLANRIDAAEWSCGHDCEV